MYPFLVASSSSNVGVSTVYVTIVSFGFVWLTYYDDPFYMRGRYAVIGMYMVFVYLITKSFNGYKISYMKVIDLCLSHCIAIVFSAIVGYIFICMVWHDYENAVPIIIMTIVQMLFANVWVYTTRHVYLHFYPPRKIIVIYGNYPLADFLRKLNTRNDKYEICENFAISEENQQLAHQIDDFFDLPLHKQLNLLDLRPTMDCDDNMIFDRQFGEKLEETVISNRQKKRPQRLLCKFRGSKVSENMKSNVAQTAECSDLPANVDLRNVFDNSIINDFGEQVRSKNEVIALRCAHDCGLCYELEPYYPGADMRADIGVRVRGHKIFVEFAGWRDNPKYEERLREKIEYAHEHNLSLVIIDMTAYPGKDGKNCMKMNYIIICRIFLYIQLGLIREGIFLPY